MSIVIGIALLLVLVGAVLFIWQMRKEAEQKIDAEQLTERINQQARWVPPLKGTPHLRVSQIQDRRSFSPQPNTVYVREDNTLVDNAVGYLIAEKTGIPINLTPGSIIGMMEHLNHESQHSYSSSDDSGASSYSSSYDNGSSYDSGSSASSGDY